MSDTPYNTEPATEESLKLDSDATPFDGEQTLSAYHPVLVDGIKGEAAVGSLGAYSERIHVVLNEEHPTLGREFMTKYFHIETPGTCQWGHDGQSFSIEKIIQS